MIPRIFIDLDDVLNNFTLSILQDLGCPIALWDFDRYPREAGFDLVKAANILLGCNRYSANSLWASVTQEMWANRPRSEECDQLLELCRGLVGEKNVAVLTAPILDPGCAAGKMEWIYKTLPRWLHRQYLISPCKDFAAGPGKLLIDDADHNVDAWRAAGGEAILWPRPWNSAGWDTWSCLAEKIKAWSGRQTAAQFAVVGAKTHNKKVRPCVNPTR